MNNTSAIAEVLLCCVLWWGLRAGAPVFNHQYQVCYFDKTIAIYVTSSGSQSPLE